MTGYGFAVLALLMAALVGAASRSFLVRAAIGVLLVVQYSLAVFGILAEWDRRPQPMLVLMAVCFTSTIALAFSPIGKNMAATIPIAALIGAQSVRLPLELLMHRAVIEGVAPPQMTYSGSNFDIITGVTAIVVALLAAKNATPRWLVVAWNALGSILLLNIIVIAVRSTPMIHAYGVEHMNTWVASAPFVWLPGILVQAALLGHLLLWRRLQLP